MGSFRGWLGEWWFEIGSGRRGMHHTLEESCHIVEPCLLRSCLRGCFLSDFGAKFGKLSCGVFGKLEDNICSCLHKRECCERACVEIPELLLVLSN